MKRNTKLLLFAHFSPSSSSQEEHRLNYQMLYDLFPGLTPGGIRSMMNELIKKRYLKRITLNGQSFFSITYAGNSKLNLLFPGTKNKERKKTESKGHVILFLESTDQDKKFFRLRQLLKTHMFTFITRGAYFYPFENFPESLFSLLVDEYSSSVMVIEAKKFSLATPDLIERSKSTTERLKKNLSGVSEQSMTLIDSFLSNKKSYDQSKIVFRKIFEKLCLTLEDNSALLVEERELSQLFFQAYLSWTKVVSVFTFSRNR